MTYPSNSESVAQDQLRAFVERIERLEEEIKALNEDKSEVYAEAKGNGFDVKVLRKIIGDRRKDYAARMEFETIYDLYAAALGMVVAPADDETGTQYATRARTSFPEPNVPAVDIGNPISDEQTVGEEPTGGHTLDQGEGQHGAQPLPDNSEADPDKPAEVETSAAPVAPGKRRWTFTDKAHADCLNPEQCGGFSNLWLCTNCKTAAGVAA